jgi:hypothetical protein
MNVDEMGIIKTHFIDILAIQREFEITLGQSTLTPAPLP